MRDGFQRAFREALRHKDTKPRAYLSYTRLYLTSEEQEQLLKQIAELVRPFEIKRGIAEEVEVAAFLVMFPQVASTPESAKGTLLSTENTQFVGSVSYDREKLEIT